jgi:hypothetical protein
MKTKQKTMPGTKKNKSPLKFFGSMIPSFNPLGNKNNKANSIFGNALNPGIGNTTNSLQDTFYPKNATTTVNKSPFKKTTTTKQTKKKQ